MTELHERVGDKVINSVNKQTGTCSVDFMKYIIKKNIKNMMVDMMRFYSNVYPENKDNLDGVKMYNMIDCLLDNNFKDALIISKGLADEYTSTSIEYLLRYYEMLSDEDKKCFNININW